MSVEYPKFELESPYKELLFRNVLGVVCVPFPELSTLSIPIDTQNCSSLTVGIDTGEGDCVCEIYPTQYTNPNKGDDTLYVKARHLAIMELFDRWTRLGYNKNKAKSPYKSSDFIEYLDRIGFSSSNFVCMIKRKG